MFPLTSQRMPEKMSEARAALDELFASSVLAHIALIVDDRPVVFPTAFAVIDNQLVIHGSTGSRWMRAIEGQDVTVEVTKIDAIVVARSTFESSVNYRSAMVFGRFVAVPGEEKSALLDALSDRLIPRRSSEVRASLKKELAATAILAMPIDEWSLRVSEGWAEDGDEDIAGDSWGGVVNFGPPSATIVAAPDLRAGIPVPASVRELAGAPGHIL